MPDMIRVTCQRRLLTTRAARGCRGCGPSPSEPEDDPSIERRRYDKAPELSKWRGWSNGLRNRTPPERASENNTRAGRNGVSGGLDGLSDIMLPGFPAAGEGTERGTLSKQSEHSRADTATSARSGPPGPRPRGDPTSRRRDRAPTNRPNVPQGCDHRAAGASIREAVSALVSYGLLARRAGYGTYVTAGIGPLIGRGLALRLTLDPQAFRHILEARKVLEGEFAYLAADRARREDLQAIETHLKAMRLHARNPEESVKEDFAFHMAIARSARNPVLFDVLNYLSDLVFRSHHAVTQSGGLSPSAMAFHERIAAAIARRAPGEARRLMLQHLDDVIRRADQLYGRHLRPSAAAYRRRVRRRTAFGNGRGAGRAPVASTPRLRSATGAGTGRAGHHSE
jgi:DNA-binding FadR family transcriptional regulator